MNELEGIFGMFLQFVLVIDFDNLGALATITNVSH